MSRKISIAFVCVHNSCRSQMAEAITKQTASDTFDAYSAGTETKPMINQDAVRLIKARYGVDMNVTQSSKLLDALPEQLDVLVTMGCNVACPYLPCKHREDWGLDDPTGQGDETFLETIALIETKLEDLKQRLLEGKISL
ncbi:MAG: arsenate reductase ArsC [Acholeplasmatales bacterium]|nr:MAG: arsenate reductase ArsC [Acholeplasmatales bacterium]